MNLPSRSQPDHQPCKVEIRIHGLLYIRIERLPHGLAVFTATLIPLIVAWLLVR